MSHCGAKQVHTSSSGLSNACVDAAVCMPSPPAPPALQYDEDMASKAAAAADAGCVMRYVGRVDAATGTASVSVCNYPASHPFSQLNGSENMIVFTTQRYSAQTPLVIRGPGAGADVTAAGVFGDLLAVLRYSVGART